jgi:hypothetical protein
MLNISDRGDGAGGGDGGYGGGWRWRVGVAVSSGEVAVVSGGSTDIDTAYEESSILRRRLLPTFTTDSTSPQ